MNRARAALLVLTCLAASACGSKPSTTRRTGAAPSDLQALFQHLPEPRVTERGPARLVLREGPAVPEPNHTDAPFPPPPAPRDVPASDPSTTFTVLGYSPHDHDTLTGAIRVTFSEPMVPVASLATLHATNVPITISPEPEGHYRWLGTDTVVFEPDARRLAQGTTYTVRLKDDAVSALAHSKRAPFSFTFNTAPLALMDSIPASGETALATSPIFALHFNQRVEPLALMQALRFSGPNASRLEVVTDRHKLDDFVEKHSEIQRWQDGTWLAVQPSSPLSRASRYTLSIPRGTRGAEGPNSSENSIDVRLETYRALAVTDWGCPYEEHHRCSPGSAPRISFNNELKTPASEVVSLLRVSPDVEGFEPAVRGSEITLQGQYEPGTTYTFAIAESTMDVYEQQLGHAQSVSVAITDADPQQTVNIDSIATLERSSPRFVPVDLLNVHSVELEAVRVPVARTVATAMSAIQGLYEGSLLQTNARRLSLSSRAARNAQERVGLDISTEIPANTSGFALVDVPTHEYGYTQHSMRFVQATDLGLTTVLDKHGGVVRVTSLATGAPVANVRISVHRAYNADGPAVLTVSSDQTGMARFNHEFQPNDYVLLHAVLGDDHAIAVTTVGELQDAVVGTVFSDRDPYRPGDTIHLRVFARKLRGTGASPIESLANGSAFACKISDAFWQEYETFNVTPNEFGTATHDLMTHADASTGTWHVQCSSTDTRIDESLRAVTGEFHVEEYRAPDIEVQVSAADGTHFQRERVEVNVGAHYMFGAAAAGLPVAWTLGRSETSFAPPGHDTFTFGTEPDFFHFGPGTLRSEHRWGRDRAVFGIDRASNEVIQSGDGVLNNRGALTVHAYLDPGTVDATHGLGPMNYTVEAQVTDTSHQAVANRTVIIAHPASIYSGTRVDKPFIRESDPIVSRHIVSDIPGSLQSGVPIRVRVFERRARFTPRQIGGLWVYEYTETDREVGHCALTSAAAPVECRVAPQHAGQYIVESTVTDSQHRSQSTRVRLWVYGGTYSPTENTGVVDITPDKTEYAPGETAHLLVRVPFANARGLLVRERAGIVSSQPLDFTGNLQSVDVPITDADVPNLNIRIALQRGRASDAELAALVQGMPDAAAQGLREDVARPQWATNSVNLRVKDASKRLRVSVRPNHSTMSPGSRLGVDIGVTDNGGHPANAEVSVIVADESVLSLLAYATPDPVVQIHRPAFSTAVAESVYDHVIDRTPMRRLGRPMFRAQNPVAITELLSATGFGGLGLRGTGRGGGGNGEGTIGLGSLGTIGHGAGFGSGAGGAEAAQARGRDDSGAAIQAPSSTRSLFATTAFYRGNVRTDARGRAHVDIDMPDNLTTFRIMAIAIGRDDRSGSGEAKVRVRKTVILRPALPRFATYGDHFQASVVVHNETGAAADFTVGIRAAGLSVENSGVARVHLARGASQLVAFPVRVDAAGASARVQFAAASAHGSDAADLSLPLVEPATGEAFATYGSLDSGVFRVPVVVPDHVIPRFGGLTLSLSSTALTGLDDAATWLMDYPYECAELLASRVVAASALHTIWGGGRAPDGEARARVLGSSAIAELQRLQGRDGGFIYWSESREEYLYLSSWVAFSLIEAKNAGLEVPETMMARALRFVAARVRNPSERLGESEAWTEQAFGLYVLAEAGRLDDVESLTRVHAHRQELPLFAKAWLERALRSANPADPRAAALWTEIQNSAVLTAAGAHFGEERVESARLLWHSERRTDAIVLADIMNRAPTDPLAERTARALASARVGGHWITTNETAWALSALVRYYRVAESATPNTNVNAWLGTDFLGTTEFHGRSNLVTDGRIPMADLLARSSNASDFVVAPTGQGRVYYRLGLRYAPTDFRLPAESQGFTVARIYEPIDAPDSVRRAEDGTWHIRNEANVRVRVTLVVPDDRYDVAVDDPLPAGLEATNMAFSTTATQGLSRELDDRTTDADSYYAIFAFEHREMRDDRTVAFARHVPAGVYELTYLARATTEGRFVATATHVEEMYAPESFGRGLTEVVVIDR